MLCTKDISILPVFTLGDLTEFDTERRLECLREQLAEKQLAVGEAGLDKLAVAPMRLQVAVFKEQVELSEKYELPLIIHCEGYGRTACLEKGTCTETAVDMAWIPWKA